MATTKANTTTGINSNKISAIQTALTNYRNAIKKNYITPMGVSSKNIEKAIKGSNSEATFRLYTNTIEEKINRFLSELEQYSQLLDTMKTSYAQQDNNNTVFKDAANKLSDGEVHILKDNTYS